MEIEFKRSMKGQDVYSDSSSEYVLPDYNSDVRKILFSEARVRPAGKFVGNDEVEFTGVVVYNVIYSDAEGKIGGTSFSSDYDFTVKSPSESLEGVLCDTRIANFALRLLSPRKLSAKCSLVSSLTLNEKLRYAPSGSAFESEGGVESLREKINVRTTSSSESVEREYAEELCRLEGAIEDEVKVVYCKAEIIPESLTVEGNNAVVRGDLVMSAIIENGDAPAYLAQKRVKIEEAIVFEDLSEQMYLTSDICVTSERASIRADEDGLDIVMDIIAEFSVIGDENKEVEMISDAFSTDCSVENSYRDIEYTQFEERITSNEKHSAKIARADALEGVIREILFVSAETKIESADVTEKGVSVKGEIKYSGIASEVNDDGTISYSTLKISSPFEQNVNANCHNKEKCRIEARCKAVNAEANIDANAIYLSSDIEIKLTLAQEKSKKALVDCSLNSQESFNKEGAVVTVYYPDEGESLFEVAKKFHIGVDRLCANNSLAVGVSNMDSNSTPAIKKLLIY